jgi:hypothetical protein
VFGQNKPQMLFLTILLIRACETSGPSWEIRGYFNNIRKDPISYPAGAVGEPDSTNVDPKWMFR